MPKYKMYEKEKAPEMKGKMKPKSYPPKYKTYSRPRRRTKGVK